MALPGVRPLLSEFQFKTDYNFGAMPFRETCRMVPTAAGRGSPAGKHIHFVREGTLWFVRYCDDVLVDGKVVRKLVCKKLPVPYGGQYKSKASVKVFAREILSPVNAGTLNPQATMSLEAFVKGSYFEWAERELRTCIIRGYKQIWNHCLRARAGKIALRDFCTVHGERLLADPAAQIDAMGKLESALQNTIKNHENEITCNDVATPQPQLVN